MNRAAPVVLPPTLLRHSALRVLARDAPGEITPEGWMHRMKIAPRRISPTGNSLRRDGVRREAVEILRLGIVIRIARQDLSLAIDENFLGLQVLRHLGRNDAIAVRLPVQFLKSHAATDHRLLLPVSLVNHWLGLRA